ncbi:GtrA family protein [Leuconostoc holzapfelii]|uniref:GtrA family protein n=1 Tax=Leuconostoc holzapfelii TaxID=434464 RepID=A0A846ZCT3_9LACO|nr:GtrA family protein [Leuconostoc holzapfelii]MCT8389937.1 GtrA family protein [Leuconostoc holzapfelii]NKZ18708.1 GtrA family protein [Leuconostoc holzapfelii]
MLENIKKIIMDEKFRFLMVGGFNTFFGFLIFSGLTLSLKTVPHGYMIGLIVSQITSNFVAFYLHRKVTFRVKGQFVKDLVRFTMINAVSYAINLVALPLLVNVGHIDPISGQFLILIVTTIISFVGHKFFSFRRAK